MSISADVSGSWDDLENFLKRASEGNFDSLARFGAEGVAALRAATPKDEGDTANSWFYEIKKDSGSWSIIWGNRNVVDGANIAILLQHGHGTGTGGYVEGRDYINPALKPIFDKMAQEGWRVVTK